MLADILGKAKLILQVGQVAKVEVEVEVEKVEVEKVEVEKVEVEKVEVEKVEVEVEEVEVAGVQVLKGNMGKVGTREGVEMMVVSIAPWVAWHQTQMYGGISFSLYGGNISPTQQLCQKLIHPQQLCQKLLHPMKHPLYLMKLLHPMKHPLYLMQLHHPLRL